MQLTDNNMIDNLCAHVSMGGSAIDWCSAHKIRYCDLTWWLEQHPDQQKRYDFALNARNEWYIQAVMLELGRIATVDIREVFDADGTLRDIYTLPAHVAAVISSVETREEKDSAGEPFGEIKKIKFWDKMKALELLGKNLMLFIDRVDHRHTGDLQVIYGHRAPITQPPIDAVDSPVRD